MKNQITSSGEKMFNIFYDTVIKWLFENQHQPLVDSICREILNSPFSLPNRKLLWEQYLSSLLPTKYLNILKTYPALREDIVNNLLCFSGYTIENRIKKLIDGKILQFIDPEEKQDLVEKVFNFHNQLDRWTDGFWHNRIQENPQSALIEIDIQLKFSDKWSTSQFLTDCGYQYPCSKVSCLAWLKWSGNKKEAGSYDQWYRLLKTQHLSNINPFLIDTLLNLVFSTTSQSFFPNLCQDHHSCYLCPLSHNCQHNIQELERFSDNKLENLMLSGDIREVSTKNLIRYLAKGCWEGSESQYQVINNILELDIMPNLDSIQGDQHVKSLSLFIIGVQELNKRFQQIETKQENIAFKCSEDIFNFFNYELSDESQESFHTLILDNKHRLIQKKMITKGLLNRSLVHPREVFAPSLQLRAASIILIHNHPSGDPQPSSQDIDITNRLTEVSKIVGIKILDHVIIGKNDYFSFADQNLLS